MNTIADNGLTTQSLKLPQSELNHKRVQNQHSREASSPAWSKNDTQNSIFSTQNSYVKVATKTVTGLTYTVSKVWRTFKGQETW